VNHTFHNKPYDCDDFDKTKNPDLNGIFYSSISSKSVEKIVGRGGRGWQVPLPPKNVHSAPCLAVLLEVETPRLITSSEWQHQGCAILCLATVPVFATEHTRSYEGRGAKAEDSSLWKLLQPIDLHIGERWNRRPAPVLYERYLYQLRVRGRRSQYHNLLFATNNQSNQNHEQSDIPHDFLLKCPSWALLTPAEHVTQ